MKKNEKPAYKFNKFQEKWLRALESGEYAQCRDLLCNGKGFCCLGVACDLAGIAGERTEEGTYNFRGRGDFPPSTVMSRLKLRGDSGRLETSFDFRGIPCWSIAQLNDARMTFKQIAKYIRSNPHNVFTDAQ